MTVAATVAACSRCQIKNLALSEKAALRSTEMGFSRVARSCSVPSVAGVLP